MSTPSNFTRPRAPFARLTKALVMGALCAVLLVSGEAAWTQVRLPSMGDDSAEDLPVAAERRYGEQIMREVRRDPAYLDDPILLEYVQSLWQPLLEAARQRGDIDQEAGSRFPFEVFLVQDRSVNAFALPGGYVGLHLGLIAMTSSRDELASVLAHELSHVTQRHIARSMASASRQGAIGMVAMVLGMIAASRSANADMANAAIAGSQAAMIQGQLNFSRDMEREADRIGYGVFNAAGFGAPGMAAMFEKLDRANRMNDSGGFPYLRSHPLTVDRLAEARARVVLVSTQASRRDVVHEMMQARAQVLMDQGSIDLKRYLDEAIQPGQKRPTERALYAASLGAALLRDLPATYSALAALTAAVTIDESGEAARQAALLRAELLLKLGDAIPALDIDIRASGETSRAALLLRADAVLSSAADARIKSGALRDLEQALVTWVTVHKADATAWSLLARCEEGLGHRLRAVRAQAEARAATGDLDAAIDRLRAAQSYSRRAGGTELVDALVIDARLRDFEDARRDSAGAGRNAGSAGGRLIERPTH